MDEFLQFEDLNLEESTLENIMGDNYKAPEGDDKDKEELEKQELELKQKEQEELDKEKLAKEQKEKKDPASESDDTDKNTSPFPDFANLLTEAGLLSLTEDEAKEITTPDALVEAFKKQLEDSKFSNLSESQRRYLESIEAGIPQKDYEVIEQQLSQLESIQEEDITENEQVRFDLIAYDYINKGLSKEKAIELANRSIKLGTDVEDAKESLESLKVFKAEEYKAKIQTKKEENKLSLEKVKETVYSKDSILKDVKLNEKDKKDVYDLVTIKVDSDEEGQPLNALNKWRKDKGIEAEIVLATLYKMTNGFESLGKILDTSKSKAALELERKLKQNEIKDISENFNFGQKEYTIDV